VPDDVLQLVRRNRGVVMVNFYPGFTSTEVWQWGAARLGEQARLQALNPGNPEAVTAGVAAWVAANPRPAIDASVIADHIEHIARIAGRGSVGLGADYDGVPFLPVGMEGVDGYAILFAELMRRGWSDRDLAGLAGGNLLRALREAERVARWR
jgi:membrane dipeptidase